MAKPPIQMFEQCCWDLRGVGEEPDLRLSEIAVREGLTPGGLTRRIQPLIAGGWLRRRPGAGNDGRAATLELTPKGRAALRSVEDQIYASVERLWKSVPAAQRPNVLAGLQALVEAARREDGKR